MEKRKRIPWDALELKAVLGVGSFGCVRLAVHKERKTAYALKGMHREPSHCDASSGECRRREEASYAGVTSLYHAVL